MNGNQVLAVSMDVDGTLYRPGPRLMLRALTTKGAAKGLRLLKQARERVRHTSFPSQTALVDAVVLELGRAGLETGAARALIQTAHDQWFAELLAGMASSDALAAVKTIKEAGLRVVAFSDHACAIKVRALGFAPGTFHAAISAEDVGAYKPGRAGFEAVQAALDVPAANILHVGDRLDTDVKGALEAGMQAAFLGKDMAPAGVLRVGSLRELAAGLTGQLPG